MNIFKTEISNDNTKKYYFKVSPMLEDHIEACLLFLPQYGYIICISSQIGCSQKCKFCAASNRSFGRNLSRDEIREQVELVISDNPILLKNGFQITYMGSGEPLCNYKNVFESIDFLKQKYSSLMKVNISTTCPCESEDCFNTVDWKKYKDFLHFQYSLHFTKDEDRYHFLWPNLLKISEAIKNLNMVSDLINDTYKINYIPFDKTNDRDEDIKQLIDIMSTSKNSKLKISWMCKVPNSTLSPSNSFNEFVDKIKKSINNIEVFRSDGTDINAGCGQFYNQSIT